MSQHAPGEVIEARVIFGTAGLIAGWLAVVIGAYALAGLAAMFVAHGALCFLTCGALLYPCLRD
jgi:hypothetical protein